MKVYSIFLSIDGEVNSCGGQGLFTTFIRLAGCNLKCNWGYGYFPCDTAYAQDIIFGKEMSVDQIVCKVLEIGCWKVTITGGEPLLQRKELRELAKQLKENNLVVSVETNGSFFVPVSFGVDCWIVDFKLNSSGMFDKMILDYFLLLREQDYIKFVIGNKADFDQAIKIIEELDGYECDANYAMSPVLGAVDPNDLISWIKKEEAYEIQLNIPLHKIIPIKEEK